MLLKLSFADVHDCKEVLAENLLDNSYVKKIYDINREDISHLIPHDLSVAEEPILSQVVIDPDNQLPQE